MSTDVQKEGSGPAIQVIVLGSGGGPLEFNTTSFLVRSIASGWRRGSLVAVDAGVHLNAITQVLEQTQPPGLGKSAKLPLPHTLATGPFAGLEIPYASPSANATHIRRTIIDTYLITHPHLDHIAGFVINTAAPPGSRPKRLAGLPVTIDAFRKHVFNDLLWPNLSDENNGAGLVTYMRLVEGGSPALGDGEGKGYVEVGDGLAVKAWSVSHGHCMQNHSHKGSGTSSRYGSMDAASMSPNMGNLGPASAGVATTLPSHTSRRLSHFSSPTPHGLPQLFPQQQQQQQRRGSFQSTSQAVAAANAGGQTPPHPGASQPSAETVCVTDSSAYFIRDMATGREVLIFGDVEPDSISVLPRNSRVWQEAAPKIVAGKLAAIFIECSYDNSQSVDRLFGHLTPRFVIQELADLAAEVNDFRFSEGGQREEGGSAESVDSIAAAAAAAPQNQKKRKRQSQGAMPPRKVTGPIRIPPSDGGDAAHSSTAKAPYSAGSDDAVSPRSLRPRRHDERADSSSRIATPTAHLSLEETGAGPGGTVGPVTPASTAPMSPPAGQLPLKGLKVVIIHMKEKLDDGPPIEDLVLTELLQHEEEAQLGCEFIISRPGQDLYF